ncbi:MAG: tetratricopeptide repeat protein [Flavobacteriales bacterium]|jgi:tetratricopeptide (TPR) repeat protein
MKNKIFYGCFFLIAILSCHQEKSKNDPITFAAEQRRKSLLHKIDSLESVLGLNSSVFDRESALKLVQTYQDYYNQNTDDTLSGEFLFRAASMSVALKKPQQAINQLSTYYDVYKTASRRPEALYLIGFVYDSELNNAEKASEYYKRVIEVFPESKWAEQSKGALEFVGLTDDEIIQKLEEKAGE